MNTKTNEPLDLDELFGQARAIIVKWGGRKYELLRLEALGPKEVVQFQKIYQEANALQIASVKDEISDEQADGIVKLFDQMLQMVCKNFPINDMPFAAKSKTLEHYVTETQGKKKAAGDLKNVQTGAKSSAN